jgi:hypothetical protein
MNRCKTVVLVILKPNSESALTTDIEAEFSPESFVDHD